MKFCYFVQKQLRRTSHKRVPLDRTLFTAAMVNALISLVVMCCNVCDMCDS